MQKNCNFLKNMNSFIKYIFIPILLVLAGPTYAVNQDFLFVHGKLEQNAVTVNGVEQRVFNSEQIFSAQAGTYRIVFQDGDVTIGNAYFEIPEPGSREAIYSEEQFGEYVARESYFSVTVPLNTSAKAENLTVEVSRDGKVIFSKNLSDIPYKAVDSRNFLISTPAPSIILPQDEPYLYSWWQNPWIIIGGIGTLVAVALGVSWWLKKRNLITPPSEPPIV